MTTKHTPAPWMRVHNSRGRTYRIISSANETVTALPIVGGIDDFDENEANARIIAAAPELLAALEKLIAQTVADGKPATHALLDARAAIAKAKGEPA